ncbi:Kinesin-like protein KIF23, partial [Frankliniella fusca]
MALLNCLQRPEDPGGFAQAHGDHALCDSNAVGVLPGIAASDALFWEDKCHALLRELGAAHVVSQAMVRDFDATLQNKELEWQQRLSERERCREERANALKQLRECEQQWKNERAELQMEERARAAFGKVMARNRDLQQRLQEQQEQQEPPETSEKGVQAESGARCLSRAVQCGPVRLCHKSTATARPVRQLHRGTCTDVLHAVVRVDVGVQGAVGGAGDPAACLRQDTTPGAATGAEPPQPPREVPTENLLDVSVDRLDELLRPQQERPAAPPTDEPESPDTGGLEDLEGVLTAVRARLVSALESHLAQRSRLSCTATQTDTPSTGADEQPVTTHQPLPTKDDEDSMQVDLEDGGHRGARERVQYRSQETQVCSGEVQLEGHHNRRATQQHSQGTQAGSELRRELVEYLQGTLSLERHALAKLNCSLTGMTPGLLRRCAPKRLARQLPVSCESRHRRCPPRPTRGSRHHRPPVRGRERGPESWRPREWRRLRDRVRRQIWQRASVEGLVRPVTSVTPSPGPAHRHLQGLSRHCLRTVRSRAALRLRAAHLAARLQEAEEERRSARSHIEFLQRRLQQLIQCSAVNARDLAALRSVHEKLTGQLSADHKQAGLGQGETPPLADKQGKKQETSGDSEEKVVTPGRGGTDRSDKSGSKWSEEQLDHTPTRLVEGVPDDRELTEVIAHLTPITRAALPVPYPKFDRGLPPPPARRVGSCCWSASGRPPPPPPSPAPPPGPPPGCAPAAPAAPPNTPREALPSPLRAHVQRTLSRECAARLHAQSLAHQQHLQALRAEHHRHVQSLNAAHLQAVGKLMDQHVMALSRAREQLRAEVRAEVQRELRRDMRAVVARSTADLEALHQAELNSILRSSSDP